MSTDDPTRLAMGQLYCALMEEILARDELLVNAIERGIPLGPSAGLNPDLAHGLRVEVAYLQLRMICELIALACLVAHGDMQGARTSRLLKTYEADAIMRALERLHPDFYPRPTRQARQKDERGIWWNAPVTSGYLTKDELMQLYRHCGQHLHRGRLKDLSRDASRLTPELPRRQADRIWALLEHHEIQTIDPEVKLIGLMKDKALARPQFTFMRRRADGLWQAETAVRATGCTD